MKLIFGIWTIVVALSVSMVAAYYSIIGLTAIFAAAFIPVVIMGVVLELAKITTAIWLHSFWNEASLLIKLYLTSATVVLMLITSMGIFGFLSKAHIEQNASSGSIVAQIERVEQEHTREQETILRANAVIDGFSVKVDQADTDIQRRITAQERLIEAASVRLVGDIAIQNKLLPQGTTTLLREELASVRAARKALTISQSTGDVVAMQNMIGVNPDGALGPNTRNAIIKYTQQLDRRQSEILTTLQQQSIDPAAQDVRDEIVRLQKTTNAEIARSQQAINAFRTQLISVTTVDNTAEIAAQEIIIDAANDAIGELLTQQFELQGELRVLEVEVGPVKYIAEMVYGESSHEILEKAVRWVIITLVLVFDPLAIVLVISGLSIVEPRKKQLDITPEILHTDTINVDTEESESDTNITLTPVATTPVASPPQDTALDDTVEKSEQLPVGTANVPAKSNIGITINRTIHDK
jgi:hypothetical protein